MPNDARNKLEEVSGKLQNIFPMPQVLAKILKAVNDPQASAASVEHVFKYEPSFTLKILTLANSAYYGSPGKITNLRGAITLLGFTLIRSIAIHASVNEFFNFGTNTSLFSGYDLWRHSVGVAVCSKMLSRRLKLGNAEDMFTLGILHDVGLIIEYQVYRDKFLSLLSQLQDKGRSLISLEQEILELDHASLAQLICERWNLQEDFGQILRFHHTPLEAPERVRPLACALYIANGIVKNKKYGFYYSHAEETSAEILKILKIEPVDLEVLAEDFDQEAMELAMFLD